MSYGTVYFLAVGLMREDLVLLLQAKTNPQYLLAISSGINKHTHSEL